MEIGDKIKYHRKHRGLTQEDLAKDICSVSYLSKIENNQSVPHHEILELLYTKLEITTESENTVKIEEYRRLMYEWYETIKSKNIEKAKDVQLYLSNEISSCEEPIILIDFQIYSLRYYLLIKNLTESKKLILKLKDVEDILADKQKYYFRLFSGLYYYLQNELGDSLTHFLEAEKIGETNNIKEPELYYLLSLTHSRLYQVSLAIFYSNIALKMFNQNMNFTKSIEVISILSINLIRLKKYDNAEFHLSNSLRIAEESNNTYLISNVYHNFGYLYSKKNQHNIAIDYYLKSINFKKANYIKYTNTILYLSESYFALNNKNLGKNWLKTGLKISEEKNIIESQIKFHLLILKNLEDNKSSLHFLEKTAIPYLQEKQSWKELCDSAEILADYYSKLHLYKKSYYYCSLINITRKNIQM